MHEVLSHCFQKTSSSASFIDMIIRLPDPEPLPGVPRLFSGNIFPPSSAQRRMSSITLSGFTTSGVCSDEFLLENHFCCRKK